METIMEGNRIMTEGILSLHPAWRVWIGWMVLVNAVALLFAFKNVEARVIFAAFVVNALFMCWLAGTYGYVRLLGLSHVIFWTPLAVYLILRIRKDDFEKASFFGRYALAVLLTNGVSLAIDYIDVIRYFAGGRGVA